MIPGPTELIIIAVVVVLLFGSKKLPDAARSLGRSLRIFKSEVKEMQKDDQISTQQMDALQQPDHPGQQPNGDSRPKNDPNSAV